jgi:serine protease inhibitor
MFRLNKLKFPISLLIFCLTLTAVPSYYIQKVKAVSVEKVKQWDDKKGVSSIKTWKINFKSQLYWDSLDKAVTVTDSIGNIVDVGRSIPEGGKSILVYAPKDGYKPGETYYLNISQDLKFTDKSNGIEQSFKNLKQPIQMKFTIDDIGTIDINEESSVIQGNNNFAFNLMKQLINKDKNKNIIISPLSISTILAETQNGANGQTKNEILSAIGLKNIDEKSINEQYYSTLDYYNNLKSSRLKVADSIWVNKTVSLNKDFVDTAKNYYNSEVNSVDFDNPNTVGTINQWVDKSTDGQIKQIIDNIDKYTKAILINSISFKGTWKNEFSPYNTKEEEFTLSSGEKVKIDTMQNTLINSYLKEDNFQAVRLPYYDGLEMDLFLPDKGVNINDFMEKATKENFDKWLKDFSDARVNMKIPKFKLEYTEDKMADVLKNLGVQQVFDANKSNLDGIAKDTFISSITHKTCISVDEKGTEAAAVTAEIMAGSSAPSEYKNVDFVVDRPFVFAIRDCKTGAIIFIGKIENPKQ